MRTKKQIANLKKWVKALKSGKYRQAVGTLHSQEDHSYCCLGVACSVLDLPGNERNMYSHSVLSDSIEIDSQAAYDKLGLNHANQKRLIDLNDEKGYTFAEIADYIEQHYIGTK